MSNLLQRLARCVSLDSTVRFVLAGYHRLRRHADTVGGRDIRGRSRTTDEEATLRTGDWTARTIGARGCGY